MMPWVYVLLIDRLADLLSLLFLELLAQLSAVTVCPTSRLPPSEGCPGCPGHGGQFGWALTVGREGDGAVGVVVKELRGELVRQVGLVKTYGNQQGTILLSGRR